MDATAWRGPRETTEVGRGGRGTTECVTRRLKEAVGTRTQQRTPSSLVDPWLGSWSQDLWSGGCQGCPWSGLSHPSGMRLEFAVLEPASKALC